MAYAGVPSTSFSSVCVTNSHQSIFRRSYYLKHTSSRSNFPSLSATHAGATINGDDTSKGEEKWDASQYQALLKGGEQVTSVLEEMIKLVSLQLNALYSQLEDMNMDEASEEVAVQLAAQGVIGKRVDQMESGFMMALDYMIQLAARDEDDKTMESRPVIPERKLLARLVLIREEARSMMCGGILDERNDRGLNTLPEPEVNFLAKLVALRPGKTVRDMIKRRASITGRKPLSVRPGMFLETVSKILSYSVFNVITGSSEYTANSSRNRILVPSTVVASGQFCKLSVQFLLITRYRTTLKQVESQ
ncbi:hypothetical protein SASPL_101691 [Salvia splendens]|uniref:Uncharacterized protein n=1 Tax=Salvia splendens TaxID=180675 RepID=A0A8X8YR99_SALSN|nr:hypothetical protein SASPL_101691 [Salvia splendens]